MVEIVKDIEKLTQKSERFPFNDTAPMNPSDLAHLLLEVMRENDGLGLSAIQIGIPLRVFCMRTFPEAFVCFNPVIAMPSTETVKLDEACLSFPGLVVPKIRSQHVRVRFAGPDGDVRTHTFTGMTARVFLHEHDHCEGKLFFEGTNRMILERAIKNAGKKGHHYVGLMRYAKKTI